MGVELNPLNFMNPALHMQATQTQQKKAEDTKKTSKSKFSKSIDKARAELELKNEGLPPEIAEMSIEEAAVYLRDAADIAADQLLEKQTPENFAQYRTKISQFIKYIAKNNFEILIKERRHLPPNVKNRKRCLVRVIEQNLDEMARDMLSRQRNSISLTAKVHTIKGLVVDLFAGE